MSGKVYGKIECWSHQQNSYHHLRVIELFKAWYDFMQTLVGAGVAQRIAFNFGDTGTGTDNWDGANPFSANAWALYRMPANTNRKNDIWIRGTCSGGGSGGSSAAPMAAGGTTSLRNILSLAYASALESDGVTNGDPWGNAVRNNDGTDLVGQVAGVGPVWVAPAGGSLAVWPISNTDGLILDGGSPQYETNKQNTHFCRDFWNLTPVRFGFLADSDNFLMYGQPQGAGSSYFSWVGKMDWADHISPAPKYDLVSMSGSMQYSTQTYGHLTGFADNSFGGVYAESAQAMRPIKFGVWSQLSHYEYGYTTQLGPLAVEEFPLGVSIDYPDSDFGVAGQADPAFIRAANARSMSVASDFSRYAIGSDAPLMNVTVPWDGVTRPNTNFTRSGIDFSL